jgi:hypothetical protein
MRVTPEARVAEQRREAGRRGDFNAALHRAEARRTEAGRADAGREARRDGDRLVAARGEEARGRRGDADGASPRSGSGEAGEARSAAGMGTRPGESEVGSGPTPLVAGPGSAPVVGPGGAAAAVTSGEAGRAALAQAVRALPPVIETFGASGQAALAIDFGGSLGVELRQAPGGVEVRLSASAALRPAARAELAGLCRTLAARGVAVVSAEVCGGRAYRGRQR